MEFKSKVEKQLERRIKILRSDNGKEYCSRKFNDFLRSEGIQHHLSVEYTPEQNGVAERRNRTLLDMARCMLLQSGLPPKFWAEAVLTATYLRNRCPSRSLNGETPHKIWTGKIPTAAHFQIFGTKGYMLNKANKGKFDQRSIECIFIGYSTESKAYRMWDSKSQKIRRSRDVKFVKDFETPKNSQNSEDDDILEKSNDTMESNAEDMPQIILTNDPSKNGDTSKGNIDREHVMERDLVGEPATLEMRRAPGRPRKVYTGNRGRPRKLFHMVHTEQSEQRKPETAIAREELAGLIGPGDP